MFFTKADSTVTAPTSTSDLDAARGQIRRDARERVLDHAGCATAALTSSALRR